MAFSMQCPNCAASQTFADGMGGRDALCKKCGGHFTIVESSLRATPGSVASGSVYKGSRAPAPKRTGISSSEAAFDPARVLVAYVIVGIVALLYGLSFWGLFHEAKQSDVAWFKIILAAAQMGAQFFLISALTNTLQMRFGLGGSPWVKVAALTVGPIFALIVFCVSLILAVREGSTMMIIGTVILMAPTVLFYTLIVRLMLPLTWQQTINAAATLLLGSGLYAAVVAAIAVGILAATGGLPKTKTPEAVAPSYTETRYTAPTPKVVVDDEPKDGLDDVTLSKSPAPASYTKKQWAELRLDERRVVLAVDRTKTMPPIEAALWIIKRFPNDEAIAAVALETFLANRDDAYADRVVPILERWISGGERSSQSNSTKARRALAYWQPAHAKIRYWVEELGDIKWANRAEMERANRSEIDQAKLSKIDPARWVAELKDKDDLKRNRGLVLLNLIKENKWLDLTPHEKQIAAQYPALIEDVLPHTRWKAVETIERWLEPEEQKKLLAIALKESKEKELSHMASLKFMRAAESFTPAEAKLVKDAWSAGATPTSARNDVLPQSHAGEADFRKKSSLHRVENLEILASRNCTKWADNKDIIGTIRPCA